MEKEQSIKQRNITVDIIRAFAILMVVLGHTISGSSIEYENSLLFQFIWTLQMPLFFLLSGFLCKYAKPILSLKDLFIRIGKKTLAYILPWGVWTFLIRGLVFGQTGFFDLGNLIYHMDSGYWFLFAIWIIVILFDVASFISFKIFKDNKKLSFVILTSLVMAVFTILLFVIGYLTSQNMLCIKLIVYYIPIYVLGFIYGKVNEKLASLKKYNIIEKIVVAVAGIVYLGLINRFDFFSMADSGLNIILRYACSILGCIPFCWFVNKIVEVFSPKVQSNLLWIGQHTLEIYVVHYLLLNLIKAGESAFPFTSIQGFGMVMINYILTLLITICLLWFAEKNTVIKKILFWK